MQTLIVVDMQPAFSSARNVRLQKNCLREIKQAIEKDAPIVFLEYDGCGRTFTSLTNDQYKKSFFKTKRIDDGSKEVESAVVINKLPANFKVVGVNTDCCVLKTVQGLMSRFPQASIEVIADACNSDFEHHSGLSDIKNLKRNVKVVDTIIK